MSWSRRWASVALTFCFISPCWPLAAAIWTIEKVASATELVSGRNHSDWLISWSNQCMRRKTEKETCRYSIHDSTSSFFQWSQHNICFLQWSAFIQQSCRLMSGPSVSICSSNCCSVGTSWPLVASWMIEKEIKEQKAPWTITVVSMIPPAPFATFLSDTFWMRSSCISEKHV